MNDAAHQPLINDREDRFIMQAAAFQHVPKAEERTVAELTWTPLFGERMQALQEALGRPIKNPPTSTLSAAVCVCAPDVLGIETHMHIRVTKTGALYIDYQKPFMACATREGALAARAAIHDWLVSGVSDWLGQKRYENAAVERSFTELAKLQQDQIASIEAVSQQTHAWIRGKVARADRAGHGRPFSDLATCVRDALMGLRLFDHTPPLRAEFPNFSGLRAGEVSLITTPFPVATHQSDPSQIALRLIVSVKTYPGIPDPVVVFELRKVRFVEPRETRLDAYRNMTCLLWPTDTDRCIRPRSWDRPLYAFRGGFKGAGASSTDSKIAANIERGF